MPRTRNLPSIVTFYGLTHSFPTCRMELIRLLVTLLLFVIVLHLLYLYLLIFLLLLLVYVIYYLHYTSKFYFIQHNNSCSYVRLLIKNILTFFFFPLLNAFIPTLANSIPIQIWYIVRSVKKCTVDFG